MIISAADPSVIGGQELQTLQVASALAQDLEFVLVVEEGIYAERARSSGLKVHTAKLRAVGLDRAAQSVRKIIEEERPQVVQTMEVRGNYLGRMAAHSIQPRPRVLTVRHELFLSTYISFQQQARRRAYLMLDRFTAKKSDLFVTVSGVVARELSKREGITPNKVRVIGNAVPDRYFDQPLSREEYHSALEPHIREFLKQDSRTLLFAGRLSPLKKADIAILSLRELRRSDPATRLLIVGDGPERSRLVHLVEKADLDQKVCFAGQVQDLRPFFCLADVLLHPSVHEVQPLTIMEAMACGVPVIAANVGGVSELIENGRTGFLVAPNSVPAMVPPARALFQDDALHKAVSESARSYATAHFWEKDMVQKWRELYFELLV